MFIDLFWIIAGFILLMGGADYLIKGACELANRLGASPLIIGLTVIAAGTSAPELFVSANAALKGAPDVAIGNVIGSNIFNILGIIGIAALFKPLKIAPAILKREMPLMITICSLFVAFSFDRVLSRIEGAIFCFAMLAYLVMNYVLVKTSPVLAQSKEIEEVEIKNIPVYLALLFIVLGIIAMVYGSSWVVDSATVFAKAMGVSDLVIGITLIAIGTSLPEVAATIAAARSNQAEMALGNAIGSNIFNVLSVLGITAVIQPINVSDQVILVDNWVMLASCLLVYWTMRMTRKVGRVSGSLFIVVYVAYLAWLVFSGMV